MSTGNVIVLVGTRKGGFIYASDTARAQWRVTGPHMRGYEIYHAIFDPRDSSIWMAANHSVYGPEIVRSTDMGDTWSHSESEPRFGDAADRKLEALWHIEPGRPGEPAVTYVGAAPASLWRSEDSGRTWKEIESFSNHSSRPDWVPGAGGLCLHTIILDPNDGDRIYLGASAIGFFRSDDGGKTWQLKTEGIPKAVPPKHDPAAGMCVHKAVMDPVDLDTFYQQNHMGVFRSRDRGESWQDIGSDLPESFGFPILAHPRRSGTIYTVPINSAAFRAPSTGELRVFRSRDGGDTWAPLAKGLPQSNAYVSPLREGLASDRGDPLGLYLGTNSGLLFASSDEGESWRRIADALPPILSVDAAVLPD